MKRISCVTHIPCSHSQHLSEGKHSPLALQSQAWKTTGRMCACGQGGMRAMLCVDGTRLVLKAAGRKNECSCTGRRRNAYTILCPQTWISLDGDVRWERHILNTCFHICIFSFWRHFALLHALCPHSALTSFPSHAKPVSPLMKSVVVLGAERPGGSGAHVHVLGLKKTGHASACGSTGELEQQRSTHPAPRPPTAAPRALRVC